MEGEGNALAGCSSKNKKAPPHSKASGREEGIVKAGSAVGHTQGRLEEVPHLALHMPRRRFLAVCRPAKLQPSIPGSGQLLPTEFIARLDLTTQECTPALPLPSEAEPTTSSRRKLRYLRLQYKVKLTQSTKVARRPCLYSEVEIETRICFWLATDPMSPNNGPGQHSSCNKLYHERHVENPVLCSTKEDQRCMLRWLRWRPVSKVTSLDGKCGSVSFRSALRPPGSVHNWKSDRS